MHGMNYWPPTRFPIKHDSRLYDTAKINKELAGSTINWNEFSLTLPEFTRILLLSISLIGRNQKSVPSFIFQNLRTLSLGLLEASFNWIIQLLATTPCLVKLKLTGLVDADGFVVNQRWIRLFESAQTLVRIFVNVSLELDDESYHCEKIQAPLCALNLSLICNCDDNDCNLYYGTVNRWWSLRASSDVQNMIAIEVAADGNCLYNSIICLNGNKASAPSELRVRSLIELVKNENFYHNRFAHIVGLVNETIKNIARNFSFSELYEIAALSNVLKCNMQSVYPTIDYRSDLNIMNNTFEHAQYSIASKTICLFWTHSESGIEARRNNAGNWSPNHFVPLLLPSHNSQSQNHLGQPKISGSGSTPTKATTKNNILTQVCIPEFNADDNEMQPFQVPSTIITTTNEIATPRTKRRLQLAETGTSFESTIVEQKCMQARERMAAKRAAATPEEAERQRILARERSAAKITVLAPEVVERKRALDRERSAARRATLTPEEIERQRALNRERNAVRRAALTSDELEQQPALNRERNAVRRAALTSDDLEQQQALNRKQMAAWRATLTSKEAEQQRTLAVDRSMAKRATATPIDAEEQRVLARERSTTRRAARESEEAKQQQTVAYKTTRLQKTGKQKQTVMKRKPNQDAKVDWPKPVDMDRKINCLKNFIQHMSMDSLAESVCGICNVRRFKRDLRHVPLSKIPSIELLKILPDLHRMIPKIQEINSFNSNGKFHKNDDIGFTSNQDERNVD
ncbi:unnamed protein product [Rotaria magnacalcarata]|uniref:OTU domain-containing protein n=1 Tax=Rotaria magnacalcarata TaxID=392030 RepID=A0A820DCQ2_9BILA|nr:unnamed protein product [Rotaria magnacalcarata]